MTKTPDRRNGCDECGQPHPKCNGHRKNIRPLVPCMANPKTGFTACRVHGGDSPQAKKAAKSRVEKANAEAAVITFGLPIDIDPDIALVEELARTHGHVRYLAAVIAELKQADLVFGVSTYETGRGPEGDIDKTTHTAAINVWVQLYQLERKHLTDVAKAMLAAGFKEREIRLVEEQGKLIADVLRAVFGDPELGLSAEQAVAARKVASRHLRVIDGEAS